MIDQEALKQVGKDLAKRGGSDPSERWIQVSKIDKPIDIRIMDPLPSMGGIYFLEVAAWWIDGHKIYSPKITFSDPTKEDIIGGYIREAELAAKKDKTLANLLSAKNEHKMPKIQFKYEYWIPVLKFSWDDKDVPNIIKKGTVKDYIEDGRVKMLVAPLTVLKLINAMLTDRFYKDALDPNKGQNFQIQKSGEGRNTKYTVIPRDVMAMPPEFYTDKMMTDPFEIAQALMVTDEYMEAVICKYLYNDVEIPENKDTYVRFPEIKEKLKDRLTEAEGEDEAKEPPRQRPGRTPQVETQFERRAPAPAPAEGRRAPAAPAKTPEDDLPWEKEGASSLASQPEPKRTPGRPAGRRRNLAEDLSNPQ